MTDFLRLSALPLLGLSLVAHPAVAQDIRSYTKTAPYEDVKFELSNAIVNRGLVIDYTGQIGKMVERTGADVGSTKPLYAQAEFLTFCSAKLSRAMMEAELSNVGFCPYVVFIYEAAGKLGETVVGFRRPSVGSGSEASKKALADIDALLEGIAKDAVK